MIMLKSQTMTYRCDIDALSSSNRDHKSLFQKALVEKLGLKVGDKLDIALKMASL